MKEVLKRFWFLFLFSNTLEVVAQDEFPDVHVQQLDSAFRLVKLLKYDEALPVFEKIYENTSRGDAALGIGICLFHSPLLKYSSEKYFETALAKNQHEANYYLAILKHLNHEFDAAVKYYLVYLTGGEKSVDWMHVNHLLNKSLYAKERTQVPVSIIIENPGPPVNTKYAEYLPLPGLNDSSFIFTSVRPSVFSQDSSLLEDIYSTSLSEPSMSWKDPVVLDETINSPANDAAVAMIPYGSQMLITRRKEGAEKKEFYLLVRRKNSWNAPVLYAEIIGKEEADIHSVCFGPGMHMVIFSAKMTGGKGGYDLYRSIRIQGGIWSNPVNLGPAVNTEFDEVSPSLSPDGKSLYFSSAGHKNMGGYDIFRSKIESDGNYSIPENLGYPVNSVEDDLHFVIDPLTGDAWFSSLRKGGMGDKDIYRIKSYEYIKKEWVKISGKIIPEEGMFDGDVTLTVIDEETQNLQGIYSANPAGDYEIFLVPFRKYKILVESEAMAPFVTNIYTQKNTTYDFKLKRK